MKKSQTLAFAVAAGLSFATAGFAQQSEVLVIANGAANDSTFAMGSYRYALSGDHDSGVKLRFDYAQSQYPLVGETGTLSFARIGAAYAVGLGGDQPSRQQQC